MKKETSFGTLETLLERDGKVVSEVLVFKKEGRSHAHSKWENCFVAKGEGTIIILGKEKNVNVCKIPPHTDHWMIPKHNFEVLLVYSETEV